jgi:glutaredoxin
MKYFATGLYLLAALFNGHALAEAVAQPVGETAAVIEAVKTAPSKTEPPATQPVKQEQPAAAPQPAAEAPAAVVPTSAAYDLYVPVVDSGVIVYAEPKNRSTAVGLIESGAGVSATGEEQNGYMRVQGGKIAGWVDKQLLRKSSAEQIMGEARKYANKVTHPRIAVTKIAKLEKSVPVSDDGKVVLYSASWCPYCDKARAYFQRNGVAFNEYDTEKNAKGRRDYEAMNGDGIPIILVSNHKIVGWKQREFERHYGQAEAVIQAEAAPAPAPVPAPVAQVARAVTAPVKIISSEAGPAYAPKISGGVIVYSQPTNKSPVGGLIKGSDQVIALGEEQNGYMRVQGSTGEGWVDKSLMKKL